MAISTFGHRHAGLPRIIDAEVANLAFRRLVISLSQGSQLGTRLASLMLHHKLRRTVIHQNLRLQVVDHLEQFFESIVRPLAGHMVKPEHIDLSIVG